MADQKDPEPRGLGEHTRGLAAEYAHEQGWQLDEAERTQPPPPGPQDTSGGTNYEYGARDFGDEPINADRFPSEPDRSPSEPDRFTPEDESSAGTREEPVPESEEEQASERS